MGGSSGGGTQTTEPPKWQRPYIEFGMNEAQSLYNSPNGTVAPMSGQTNTALDAIQNRAQNNQFTQGAQNFANSTLGGSFMSSNPFLQSGPNPHLDATFNQAALATQNQLASQFAGSGRNVDASEGLRSQQLNQLATGIYGGAYESDQNRRLSAYDAERNRQQQVLGMTPGLNQAGYSDLDRLLGVGQAREGYDQRQLDARGSALDQYIGRVGGNVGTTIKTTQNGSGLAGAAGGALLGAQFGSIIPGIGTGIGALGGGLLGGLWG